MSEKGTTRRTELPSATGAVSRQVLDHLDLDMLTLVRTRVYPRWDTDNFVDTYANVAEQEGVTVGEVSRSVLKLLAKGYLKTYCPLPADDDAFACLYLTRRGLALTERARGTTTVRRAILARLAS